MKNLFNVDGKFFSLMEKTADIMILNFLFLITSLPLITIGTSLTALYSVSLRQSEGTSSYIVKEYFQAWKSNFRQSIILWCCSLFVYILLISNLKISSRFSVMHFVITLILILSVMLSLYIFPLLAKFNNTLKHTVVNAFLLSIRHFFTTIVLAATSFFFIYITAFSSVFFEHLIVSWMLFLFALIVRIHSVFLNRLFMKYTSGSDIS